MSRSKPRARPRQQRPAPVSAPAEPLVNDAALAAPDPLALPGYLNREPAEGLFPLPRQIDAPGQGAGALSAFFDRFIQRTSKRSTFLALAFSLFAGWGLLFLLNALVAIVTRQPMVDLTVGLLGLAPIVLGQLGSWTSYGAERFAPPPASA